MVDNEKLKNLRVFVMTTGEEYIGYVESQSIKSITLDGACKLVSMYNIDDSVAGTVRAIYNVSSFSVDRKIKIRRDHVITEVQPTRQTVELWLKFVYADETDEDPLEEIIEVSSESHLSLV